MLRYITKVLCHIFIVFVILIALIATLPGLPPHTTFSEVNVLPPLPRTGVLAPNNILDGAKRLFEGRIVGPESVAWRRTDELFVGLHDGTIQRIYGNNFDQISKVTLMGEKCDKLNEKTCGNPLGLRFAPNGRLLVADPYLGIYSVDPDTGEKECLVSPDDVIDGKPFRFPDDVDIDNEGNIYWSDASTIADFTEAPLLLLSDPTGRLVKYNPQTKTNTVLMDKIHFANGVQLSPNQDFVLLSETARSRVQRYWLKGSKIGQSDIFVDQLPGSPDNIRPRPNGGYYISLCLTKHHDKPDDIDELMKRNPIFRKIICRILKCIQLFFRTLNKIMPYSLWEKISNKMFDPNTFVDVLKEKVAIVVEVDENGSILGSLQGLTGNLQMISETAHVGDNIFFGSPYMNYLGHVYVGRGEEIKNLDENKDFIENVNDNDNDNDNSYEEVVEKKDEL